MFTVHVKPGCFYSEQAVTLLKRLGYKFRTLETSKDELRRLTGLATVTYPQVYDGNTRIGGFERLEAFLGVARQRGARWKPPRV